MAADTSNHQVVERYAEALPTDWDALSRLRHADFVEDWPQSGERIRGHASYRAIHESYPGGQPTASGSGATLRSPSCIRPRLRRVMISDTIALVTLFLLMATGSGDGSGATVIPPSDPPRLAKRTTLPS